MKAIITKIAYENHHNPDKMERFENLIAVGATNRNLGKTEFICRLLERFQNHSVIAIKIKTQYEGDERYHGRGGRLQEGYIIREENETTGLEDSKRFLAAGAQKVFYIKSRIEDLRDAIIVLKSQFSESQLFICESNSLLEYYKPGGFILIFGPDKDEYKASSLKFQDRANIRIKSYDNKFDIDPPDVDIRIESGKWRVKSG